MMTRVLAAVVVYGPVALLVAWALVRVVQQQRRMRGYWAGDDNQRR